MSLASTIPPDTPRLGMAEWEGRNPRLVAPLPGDPARVVDLSAMEAARLRRLGEGAPEGLAQALVPSELGALLAAGPRGLVRARQALAYAAKWHRRGDLPEALAPTRDAVEFLPCLARPRRVFDWEGRRLKVAVAGPGAILTTHPQPTLAALGWGGGQPAGFCLALPEPDRLILGAWLTVGPIQEGRLLLRAGGHQRSAPLDAWAGLGVEALAAGEVVLLPPPRLRRMPELGVGPVEVACPWEDLDLRVEGPLGHPLLQ